MTVRQIVGVLMASSVGLTMLILSCLAHGVLIALATWGAAIILAAVLVGGIHLAMGD